MSRSLIPDINITSRLFYNMNGVNIRTLKVYATNEDPLFTKTGNQGGEWKKTSMTTFIPGSQKVRFCRRKFSIIETIFKKSLFRRISSPVQKFDIHKILHINLPFSNFICNLLLLFFV